MVCKGLVFILFFVIQVFAETQLGVGASLVQDQDTLSSQNISHSYFYDASVFLTLGGSKRLYLGISYVNVSTYLPNATTLSTNQIASSVFVGLRYTFPTSELMAISIMTSPMAQTNYVSGDGTSTLWSGTAILVKAGIYPPISATISIAVEGNYYSATYNTKSSGSASTAAGFSRTLIAPTIGIQYRY